MKGSFSANQLKTVSTWLGPLSKTGIRRQLRIWRDNIKDDPLSKSLLKRIYRMQRLIRRNEYPHLDDFFFSIEDLPYLGKEYWFLHFVVPGSDEQVVITIGRSKHSVTVNKSKVKKITQTNMGNTNLVDCAAVCWVYSNQKEIIIDSSGEVGLKKTDNTNRLFFRKGRNKVVVEGKYPCFHINLKKDGKKFFSVKTVAKKKGLPWEMSRFMITPIINGVGAIMVTYYFDFNGHIKSKPVKGRAYLQKVVATVPFTPWNWVRLEFQKGATLDYFTGKPLGTKISKHLFPSNNSFELSGKRFKLNNMKLTSFLNGDTRRWVLSGDGFFASMESYSLQPFSIKNKTKFQYDEYLVRVKDFFLKSGGRTYTMDDLGPASGIVEDAHGYLI